MGALHKPIRDEARSRAAAPSRQNHHVRSPSSGDGAATPSQTGFYALVERWHRALLSSPRITAAQFKTAVLLLKFASRTLFAEFGELVVWPGKDRLHRLAGRHERKIYEHVAKLLDAGVLNRTKQGGGPRNTSEYVFDRRWLDAAEVQMGRDGTRMAWDKLLPLPPSPSKTDSLPISAGIRMPKSAGIIPAEIGRGPIREETIENHPNERARAAGVSSRQPAGKQPAASGRKTPWQRKRVSAEQFKTFWPSRETAAFISEHCAAVADPDAPRHVAKFINNALAKDRIPRDPDAAFRLWMVREQEFAVRDQRSGSSTPRRRGSNLMDEALRQAQALRDEDEP